MPQAIFAYHLGMDAEQYAFFRIPKLLITEPYFRRLSTDAKLLYGLMLDRMSLSMRNGWMDDDGHVYIYFTLEEACEQLCCKTDKAVKLFAELDSAKGVGLIRRVKQGLGRPAKIYVLRFMGMEDEPGEDTPKAEPPSCRNPDFGKTEVKSSEKPKSEPRKIRSQDLGKTECNKTDKNNTELSNTDSSIHPGAQPEEVIEGYRKEIRKNIEYDHLRRQHPYDDIDEIADLMLEVLCTQGSFMRIGGKQLYTALVKERFLKLDSSHIEYVLDCLRESTVTLGTDVFGNLQRMDNALEGLPIKEQACREQLSNLQTQLETAKAEVQKPFPREAELNTKTARLEELNTLLNLDHKEPEIVDAEPDEDQRPLERRRPQLER